ncbi:MAG: ABC transporter transmembrane domain-containing protein, partial [Parcubacteria group bacterium]
MDIDSSLTFRQETKMIWSYLKPYKRAVWYLSFLAVSSSIIEAGIPYLYGRLTDLALHMAPVVLILQLLAIWFVVSLLNSFLMFKKSYRSEVLSVEVSNSLYNGFLRHVIGLPVSFHKSHKMGGVVSRLI